MRKSVKESLSMEYDISMYKDKLIYSFFKRLIDIILSFIGIAVFSWLYIILLIIVPFSVHSSPIFGHERIGKNGKTIKVYKFRTMKKDDRPIEEILTKEQLEEFHRDYKITDDPRVTKLGKILRKTSLDELPQLFNVLIGNMSIVGWRPIIAEELEKYGDLKELLIKIKPGVTGYWASHGRSIIAYDKRIKMELYYVVKRSVWMDIRIIYHTFINVLFVRNDAK